MKILLLIAHAHAVLIPWDLCHLLNTNWDILDEIPELSHPPLTAMDTRHLKSKKGTKALHAPLIVRLQSYKAPRNLLCTKKTVCLNYSIKMSCNQKVQKRNQKKKKKHCMWFNCYHMKLQELFCAKKSKYNVVFSPASGQCVRLLQSHTFRKLHLLFVQNTHLK